MIRPTEGALRTLWLWIPLSLLPSPLTALEPPARGGGVAPGVEIRANGAPVRAGEIVSALAAGPYLAAFYQPPAGFQPYPYFPRRVRPRPHSFTWQAGFQWAGSGGWAVPLHWMARGKYHLGWDLEMRRQHLSSGEIRWLGSARLYATYPAAGTPDGSAEFTERSVRGVGLLLDFGLGGRLIHRTQTRLGPEIGLGLLAFPGRPVSFRLFASAGEVQGGLFETFTGSLGLHIGRLEISPGYSFFSHASGRLAGPEFSLKVWF